MCLGAQPGTGKTVLAGQIAPQALIEAEATAYIGAAPDRAGSGVQAALKLVLGPIFEADFEPCSYGFRPRRRAPEQARCKLKHLYPHPA